MRRLLPGAVVVSLMLATTTALAQTGQLGNFKDKFNTEGSFSGNDGSLSWKSPWYELGESDGPSAGAVHVDPYGECPSGGCLHLFGQGETLAGVGVKRFADLSGLAEAELCFEVTYSGEPSNAVLRVLVTADQSNWFEVKRISASTGYKNPVIAVDEWAGKGFGVKFVVDGNLDGEFFVDTVEVKVFLAPATTTTTTTEPKETTTTTKPKETTTTTKPPEATTTTKPRDDGVTHPETTTTIRSRDTTTTADTTTTTIAETTTTTEAAVLLPPTDPPPRSGLRESGPGVQADYSSGMFGSMEMGGEIEVLSADVSANYSMAVEVIKSSWVTVIALAVIIAAAIVSGIDRRRTRRPIAGI